MDISNMSEIEQLEYYNKTYNDAKEYYNETILRLIDMTQSNERDYWLDFIFEELIQLDKNRDEILQME